MFKGAGVGTRLISAKSADGDLQAEIARLTADAEAKDAEIASLLKELSQERNATAAGLFRGMAL